MKALLATALAIGGMTVSGYSGTQSGALIQHETGPTEVTALTVEFTSDSYALRTLGRGEAHLTTLGAVGRAESGVAMTPDSYEERKEGRAEAHDISSDLARPIGEDTQWGGFCSVMVSGRDC